jgi:parallel beta-helix repeat protein
VPGSPDASTTINLKPGDNVQAALINAKSGQTLLFAEGIYTFTDELSLSVPGVTLKGSGDQKTILDFAGQAVGGNGLNVTAGDFVLENLVVRDTKGDAVRVQGVDPTHLAKNVTFRKVKVYWSAGSVVGNPGYALYPTLAENVLVEDCEIHGASDAGIYVGQSKNIMVRGNLVTENENGIEIENSTGAEVTGNDAHDNVAGILVFNLPQLPIKAGSLTLVHDNVVHDNNHAKFADGSGIGGFVPSGSGMVIMAADRTEIRGNSITGNQSTGIVLGSCATLELLSGRAGYCADSGYDGFPEGTSIHDNTFSGNGTDPQDFFTLFADKGSGHLEDMTWDGVVDATKADPGGDNKLCIQNNGTGTFVEMSAETLGRGTTDLSGFACTHAAVPPVTVTWGQ